MTNDLISRKALIKSILDSMDDASVYTKGGIMLLINSAPAIQQCGDGEPIGYFFGKDSEYGYDLINLSTDLTVGTELYTSPSNPDQTARISELQDVNKSIMDEYSRFATDYREKIKELQNQNDVMREALSEINIICYVCKQDIKDITTIYLKSKTALATFKGE